MSDEIPEDVRNAASNAAGHVYDPYSSKSAHSYVTDIIARAIMAERERCAKIAEAHQLEEDFTQKAAQIATAIRG